MKLIDCSFHYSSEFDTPAAVIEKHAPAYGYARYLQRKTNLIVVKHINYEGETVINEVRYRFFRSNNRFTHIPLKTLRYINKEKADVIIVQGLIFPLQVIALRLIIGKKCKIIVQHHGERPFNGIKMILQKLSGKYINAYLFTALENANEWIAKKIIPGYEKCYEVLEASTYFKRKDKEESKRKLGVTGNNNFLWVGRLNANKDPITVLAAFEEYLAFDPNAKFYVCYQEADLLPLIKTMIETNKCLQQAVYLKGKISHEELPYWYSAADFYISGSHKEGSGYALLEAMVCGCIPIVTDIPSFRKITANGKFGFLYTPGNVDELLALLQSLQHLDRKKLSHAMIHYFERSLSFESIANNLYAICEDLMIN